MEKRICSRNILFLRSPFSSNLLKTRRNPLVDHCRRSPLTVVARRLLMLLLASPCICCPINRLYCHRLQHQHQQGHPKAASLKTVPLLFPELCAKFFDGNSASVNLIYATSKTPSGQGSSSFHVAPLKLMDAPSINIDEDNYFSNHTSEHFTQPPPSANSPFAASPSGNPNKRAKPSTLDLELLVPHLIHLYVPCQKLLLLLMI
ncbi:unnamed protein product [Lactuca saligna]|uniref:Uncharacterized protein n=1 Tax=Lactuca saligna TaxID=75948 RepID=A0AA36DYM9_LACSI|nr:unnamed protein product [Lactuca saligna]